MKNISVIIIIILFASFITWRECSRPSGDFLPADTITNTVIIPGDSVPYPVPIVKKVPVPVYRDTGSVHWREMDIDTLAILQDYFAKYFYDDILMNDTSAFIRLMAHTWQNRIYYDSLLFQNKRIKSISTTIIQPQTPPKATVYVGLGTALKTTRPELSADVLFITPGSFAFKGGYDLLNKEIKVAGYYKIRLRKKKPP